MPEWFSFADFGLAQFSMIVLVDIILSGDNAIIIGMAAFALPPEYRRRAIMYGIAIAVVFRILFSMGAFYLLKIKGLELIGGLLLLWVCWRLWNDLRQTHNQNFQSVEGGEVLEGPAEGGGSDITLRKAMVNIIVADVSMSLDNVIAVASIARDNLSVMVFGLVLSVAIMAVGATWLAKLLDRFSWLGYVGLAVIVLVAGDLIWSGMHALMAV